MFRASDPSSDALHEPHDVGLLAALEPRFPKPVRAKGMECFHDGNILSVEHTRLLVLGQVCEPQNYVTCISLRPGTGKRTRNKIELRCSCPLARGGDACEHLWALSVHIVSHRLVTWDTTRALVRVVAVRGSEPAVVIEQWADVFRQHEEASYEEERFVPAFGGSESYGPVAAPLADGLFDTLDPGPVAPPAWVGMLGDLSREVGGAPPALAPCLARPLGNPPLEFHLEADPQGEHLAVRFMRRDSTGRLRAFPIHQGMLSELASDERHLVQALLGAEHRSGAYEYRNLIEPDAPTSDVSLRAGLTDLLMPLLCNSKRAFCGDSPPLVWMGLPRHQLALQLSQTSSGDVEVSPVLQRTDAPSSSFALSKADVLLPSLAIIDGHVVAFDGDERWVSAFQRRCNFLVHVGQVDDFFQALVRTRWAPHIVATGAIARRIQTQPPIPLARLSMDPDQPGMASVAIAFQYGDALIESHSPLVGSYDRDRRMLTLRDRSAEAGWAETLFEFGCTRQPPAQPAATLRTPQGKTVELIAKLLNEKWMVVVDDRAVHVETAFTFRATTNIDWFEVGATATFDELSADLPTLLQAVASKQSLVPLSDGSWGLLSKDRRDHLDALGQLGATNKTGDVPTLRFEREQGPILDALLAIQQHERSGQATHLDADRDFSKMSQQLDSLRAPRPAGAPVGFEGTLRPYQQVGLGWLLAICEQKVGGLLADDMGLGKTIQVLALVVAARAKTLGSSAACHPSLVVAPKTLLFNWAEEARRFAPALRILSYTGGAEDRQRMQLSDFDLVLTTYGTMRSDMMRSDVSRLRAQPFHLVVLDEAQAIKNPSSNTAKAARLLQARHRLALTGTPIENRLSELWSLFEFLNPGMLGSKGSLSSLAGCAPSASAATDTTWKSQLEHGLLGRLVQPLMLRRNKVDVLPDLPPKSEQTLHCQLDPEHRRLYDELRAHYRNTLDQQIDTHGLAGAKIQVLEALLRLRQAAIHPGLIDPSLSSAPSAKLEALFDHVDQLVSSGHKVLIFSQFVSLLAIVRARLDERDLGYAYLDGQTRDRPKQVERFQTDPDCSLFLISLKAGGSGLNLTAGDYVFLLDPWWNPSVEAQAIDRAHRIGQHRPVFAYRLISEDTVEEKVLALQQTKKTFADGVLNADDTLLSSLTRSDLAHLLG